MKERFERQTYWRWKIALYLFFAGMGAGSYFVGILNDLFWGKALYLSRIGVFWGTVLVITSIPFLILDLGRKDRFLRAGINPRFAWVGRGFYILSIFIVLGVIHIGFWIWPFQILEVDRLLRIVLSIINGVFAMAVMVYTGLLLKSMRSVHFWDTPLIVILFVISALSTGIICLIFFSMNHPIGEGNSNPLDFLLKTDSVLIILETLILAFYLVNMANATEASKKSVASLIHGELKLLFWGGVILCGLVLPFLLKAFEGFSSRSGLAGLTLISDIMVLIGGLFLRYSILAAGVQATPLMRNYR